jgi:hypothetical protein
LPRILTSDLPIRIKVESFAHLLGNLGWLLGAVLTLTLYPVIIWRIGIGPYQLMKIDLPLFIATSCAIMFYFFFYSRVHKKCGSILWLLLLPVLSIGMAPTFALSVLNGAVRRGGVFARTPKFGLRGKERLPILSHIYSQQSLSYLILNTFLLAYSILPAIFAWQRGTWIALPFLAVFPLGFSIVLVKDLKELKRH